jgi:protein-S-isoprenylcysteine O-methyltransferase Ste14
MDSDQRVRPLSGGQLILTAFYLLIFPALLLGLSGDLYWTEAWVFSVIFIVLCCATVIYLYFKDPALLHEHTTAYRKKDKSRGTRSFCPSSYHYSFCRT